MRPEPLSGALLPHDATDAATQGLHRKDSMPAFVYQQSELITKLLIIAERRFAADALA